MKKAVPLTLAALCLLGVYRLSLSESAPTADRADLAVATFAGGCFWCVEAGLEKVPGVHAVVSGYSGGDEVNPTYKQVASGTTGHTETVQVHYDPKAITYEGLLEGFWRLIDPTDGGGQFVDRGRQYRSAIFFHDESQRRLAEESKAKLARSGRFDDKPIITEIVPFDRFYEAEDYHQDYYKRNPVRYFLYTSGSGRKEFKEKTWGADATVDYSRYRPKGGSSAAPKGGSSAAPTDAELRKRLTPLQYKVTQEEGTEPPFNNAYWNEKRDGIYVDIVTGEPLFSSRDKFDSGTGWPSFTKPLQESAIVEKSDYKLLIPRTEVRSKAGDSHLGHVFDDGPAPTGLRYCINSAALRFVPKEALRNEGYGEFAALFE